MRALAFAKLLICCTSLACAGASQVPPGGTRPAKCDAPVDFTALRTDYGARDDFAALCEDERSESKDSIANAMNQSNWSVAAESSERWLSSCPIDAQIHYWYAAVLLQLGQEDDAEEHYCWFKGLTDSVLTTGDGKTPETAYVTISIPEEYAVLLALRLKPISQTLLEGRAIDMLTVEDENGSVSSVYFNPSLHFTRLQKKVLQTIE